MAALLGSLVLGPLLLVGWPLAPLTAAMDYAKQVADRRRFPQQSDLNGVGLHLPNLARRQSPRL